MTKRKKNKEEHDRQNDEALEAMFEAWRKMLREECQNPANRVKRNLYSMLAEPKTPYTTDLLPKIDNDAKEPQEPKQEPNQE